MLSDLWDYFIISEMITYIMPFVILIVILCLNKKEKALYVAVEETKQIRRKRVIMRYINTVLIVLTSYLGARFIAGVLDLMYTNADFYCMNGESEHDSMVLELWRVLDIWNAWIRAWVMLIVGVIAPCIRFKTIKGKILGFILNPIAYCPFLWQWLVYEISMAFSGGLDIGG